MTTAPPRSPATAAPLDLVSVTAILHFAQRIVLKVRDADYPSLFPNGSGVYRMPIGQQADHVCRLAGMTRGEVAQRIVTPAMRFAIAFGVPRVFCRGFFCDLRPFRRVLDVVFLPQDFRPPERRRDKARRPSQRPVDDREWRREG